MARASKKAQVVSKPADVAILASGDHARMTAAAPAIAGLDPAQWSSYHARGWILVRGLADAAALARLRSESDGLHQRMAAHTPPQVHVSWEPEAPGHAPRIRQLMHSEQVCPEIDALSRSPRLIAILHQLLGPDLYLFHSKLMMKAARDGSFTPWHQDAGYWHPYTIAPIQVNCMLAIDAADAGNGAIRFVDGSHLDGLISHQDMRSDSFNLGLSGDLGAYPSTLVAMEPGDAVFFGPLVIHGSGPNTSDRDRRANTFAYDRAGNQRQGELPEGNRR